MGNPQTRRLRLEQTTLTEPRDPAYRRLKSDLIASTGLAFYADRDQLLVNLIGERLSALGLPDCTAYAALLANGTAGSAEMDVLVALLTNGETSFFRDPEHYIAIRDIIVPDILQRNQASKQIRIWSAGCASGAEPYSLAILLERELGARTADWKIAIHATDLSRSHLERAEAGKFRQWALRSTSAATKRECFSQEAGTWTIHPSYQRWISFHQMNLAASEWSTPWPAHTRFDLILCRNVMIYFAPGVNRRLVGQFNHSLEPGGWLVVGAAECNLDTYRAFCTVDAAGARLYQKPKTSSDPLVAQPEKPPTPPALSPRTPIANQKPADVAGLLALADCGDWGTAAEYAEQLLLHDRLNPAIHFYRALILENLGSVPEAERSLRQAIYLDRGFALAHYHLGLALKRARKIHAAERSFRNVLQLLDGVANDAIVIAGPGVTTARLRELAQSMRESTI